MIRVLLSIALLPALLAMLWIIGSVSARFYHEQRLRREYRASTQAGTGGADAALGVDDYVLARLPPVTRRASILIGLVVIGLPASLIGLVLSISMAH